MRIRAPKDFWSGVMFCGFAAIALFAARGYSFGSAGRMGPGYFPLLLASLLGALGVVLIGRSILIGGEPVARFRVLPLAVIATAICLFGVLTEPRAFIVSLAASTLSSTRIGAQLALSATDALAADRVLCWTADVASRRRLPLNV